MYSSLILLGLYAEPTIIAQAEQIIYDPLNPSEVIQPIDQRQEHNPDEWKKEPNKEEVTAEQPDSSLDSKNEIKDNQAKITDSIEKIRTPEEQLQENKKRKSASFTSQLMNLDVGKKPKKVILGDNFFKEEHHLKRGLILPESMGSGSKDVGNSQLVAMSYLLSGTILCGQKPEGRGSKDVQTIFG